MAAPGPHLSHSGGVCYCGCVGTQPGIALTQADHSLTNLREYSTHSSHAAAELIHGSVSSCDAAVVWRAFCSSSTPVRVITRSSAAVFWVHRTFRNTAGRLAGRRPAVSRRPILSLRDLNCCVAAVRLRCVVCG